MPESNRVRIAIEDLAVNAYLGVHDAEQKKPKRIPVSLEFEYEQPASDSLAVALDYRGVRDKVLAATENRRFRLVETLAAIIMDVLKSDPRIRWALVQVRKHGALRQAKSVVARVEWRRGEKPG
jgi:FolB domain-containing protein